MTIDNIEKITDRLREEISETRVIRGADMSEYTSFRAGGRADLLLNPEDEDELCRILKIMDEEDCPHMILGKGTNVLVRDGGYRGAIIRIGEGFQKIEREGDLLVCGAGAALSAVARKACEEGLSGFEFASGIPGSVGGAAFMNAGAYGGEMAQVIESVRLLSPDGGSVRQVEAKELELGYRTSKIQRTGEVVSLVKIRLKQGDPQAIRSRMSELMEQRNSKQPVNLPSAGSFFKRPEGHFAGKLIEDAGLGGLVVGGAQVSELHKGFIVNRGDATATDILQLMAIVQARVMDRAEVMLEPEVRIVGEE